jgi:Spx/MgsR family transcriptional regulator
MIKVYGIPNCDTVKKTLFWFKKNNIAVEFYDYKKQVITKEKLANWCSQVGWEVILNKKSTTWRTLEIAEQEKITSQAKAIQIMQANTSIIKRPVVEQNGKIIVGFDENIYQQNFKK